MVQWPKAMKIRGTKLGKKNIKDNKQRQNLGENYREKTAKMGGGTEPARQNRQGIEPCLPSINRELKQRRRRR